VASFTLLPLYPLPYRVKVRVSFHGQCHLEGAYSALSVTSCSGGGIYIYKKLALTSPTGGGRSVGIVRVRTKATEFSLVLYLSSNLLSKPMKIIIHRTVILPVVCVGVKPGPSHS